MSAMSDKAVMDQVAYYSSVLPCAKLSDHHTCLGLLDEYQAEARKRGLIP